MIELFINELSLDGQFYDPTEFRSSVANFIELIKTARNLVDEVDGRFWRSDSLSHSAAGPNRPLIAVINSMADREAKEALLDVVFNANAPASWEPVRIHLDTDRYEHLDMIVTNTSVAELAERRLALSIDGGLLNFRPSKFCPPPVPVLKNGGAPISIDHSFDDESALAIWSSSFTKPKYDFASDRPPEDAETALTNQLRYDATSKVVQGRRVYRHRTSNRLLYVDNLHVGTASHLEVFDRFGYHLGEASLDGILNTNMRDPNKRLDVS